MSYQCGICRSHRKHGQQRLVHQVKRTCPGQLKGSIEQEVPICERCDNLLKEGADYKALLVVFRPIRTPSQAPQAKPVTSFKPVAKTIPAVKPGVGRVLEDFRFG